MLVRAMNSTVLFRQSVSLIGVTLKIVVKIPTTKVCIRKKYIGSCSFSIKFTRVQEQFQVFTKKVVNLPFLK